MRVAMTVEGGTAIVLAYVLVSVGVIIAFLLTAFVIGWFIDRLREHCGSLLVVGRVRLDAESRVRS